MGSEIYSIAILFFLGMGKIILLAGILSVVLVSGILQESFAQTMPPPFDKNYVHALWDVSSPFSPAGIIADESNYPLYNTISPSFDCSNGECQLLWFPNLVDPLDKKLMKIMVEYDPQVTSITADPRVECHDPTLGSPFIASSPISTEFGSNPFSGLETITWMYECYPNPDWEDIFIFYTDNPPEIIDIWTASFDIPVSGIGIPIDKTALFIATFEANPFSILLTLSIIGAGAFGVIYSTKKKSTEI